MSYGTLTAQKANNVVPFPHKRKPHVPAATRVGQAEQLLYFGKVFLLAGSSIWATIIMLHENSLANIEHAGAIFLTGLWLQIVAPVTYQMLKWVLLRVAGKDRSARVAAFITTLTMVPTEALAIYIGQKVLLQIILR